MIDLYTAATPNGWKATITLEELGLPYTLHSVDLSAGEQDTPKFRGLNPNGRIPVIVDNETDITVFESGAILMYLAEKTGQLLPQGLSDRYCAIQWLMFQMSAVGPMLGQAMFFQRIAAPKGIVDQYAIDRYVKESKRLLNVLDEALVPASYLCGEYSMVDIATFPWVRAHQWANVDVSDLPHLKDWLARIEARAAVQRGLRVPAGRPRRFDSVEELEAAAKRNAQLYDA